MRNKIKILSKSLYKIQGFGVLGFWGPDDIYLQQEPMSDLPRWRKKIATTRYWLGEADRLRRASAW